MKKIIASYLIATTFILSPALQARPSTAPRVILADAYSSDQDESAPAAPSDEGMDQGDEQPAEPSQENAAPEDATPLPTPEASTLENTDPEGTPVSAAPSEGAQKEKSNRWRNIIIAVVAVAVAITALFLIQDNNGHHSHDK